MGTVYLLHYEEKHYHAQHYLGYSEQLDIRVEMHRKGQSRVALTRAFAQNGIPFTVARVWKNADRDFERKLKNLKNTPRLCPHCNPKCKP